MTWFICITVRFCSQDDIRLWATNKDADQLFFALMTASLLLFMIEIIVMTIVSDGFKYSFFFYLDIIATVSLIFDVPYLLNPVIKIVGASTSRESIDALPGKQLVESQSQGKINQVIKSLRLIRLIRIIKLYKYAIGGLSRGDEEGQN